MKRAVGVLLILSAAALLIMVFYAKLTSSESDVGWFTLILPAIFLYQGISYLRTPAEVEFQPSRSYSEETNLPAFDKGKRDSLVSKLNAMSGELLVPIQEFLDGNFDDQGSIGCNLYPSHPGVDAFRSAFESLLSRGDVSHIYAHISEIEPDQESWPYTDRIYVVGPVSLETLIHETREIQPTEAGEPEGHFSKLSPEVRALSQDPVRVLWWD